MAALAAAASPWRPRGPRPIVGWQPGRRPRGAVGTQDAPAGGCAAAPGCPGARAGRPMAGSGAHAPRPGPADAPSPAAAPEGLVCPASAVLDLSQRGLQQLGEVPRAPGLTQLHLQNNALGGLPGDFFQLLPGLRWLDLRFNRIRALPAGIGGHRQLRTLLLEKNPIRALPVEMGQLGTLRALNLRQCPLEFPPQLIVQKGLVSILTFLRVCASERRGPREPPSPEASPPPGLGLPAEDEDQDQDEDREAPRPAPADKGDALLPPLGPDGPGRAEAAAWPSRAEIRRFWRLRQEIVGQEPPEPPPHALLPARLPPALQAVLWEGPRGARRRLPGRPSPLTCRSPGDGRATLRGAGGGAPAEPRTWPRGPAHVRHQSRQPPGRSRARGSGRIPRAPARPERPAPSSS